MTMEATGNKQEGALTLKILQQHLTKAILGAFGVSIVAVVIGYFAFYYNTINRLDNNEVTLGSVVKVQEKHGDMLQKLSLDYGVDKNEITNIEKRLQGVENSQIQIINLLIEIKTQQKTIINK
jgi:hypothetical protein